LLLADGTHFGLPDVIPYISYRGPPIPLLVRKRETALFR
jgi:hypothetical protein